MMKTSPLMQLSASRRELQNTNVEACFLDTAATGFNDAALLRINDAQALIAAALLWAIDLGRRDRHHAFPCLPTDGNPFRA